MRHGNNKFDRKIKTTNKRQKSVFSRWVKAYVECLWENRPVEVLEKHERELELFLW